MREPPDVFLHGLRFTHPALGKNHRVRRVVVVGVSGSGKSTVASALSRAMHAPHIELDALYHGPGWQPRDEFVVDVLRLIAAPTWVVDGNYQAIREQVWSSADTVVWLDLPRSVVMRQVIRRTVTRWALRAELWNGNRERARTWLRASHPIRWAWVKHPEYRETYARALAEPWTAHLTLHRLTTRPEVDAFLADRSCGSLPAPGKEGADQNVLDYVRAGPNQDGRETQDRIPVHYDLIRPSHVIDPPPNAEMAHAVDLGGEPEALPVDVEISASTCVGPDRLEIGHGETSYSNNPQEVPLGKGLRATQQVQHPGPKDRSVAQAARGIDRSRQQLRGHQPLLDARRDHGKRVFWPGS